MENITPQQKLKAIFGDIAENPEDLNKLHFAKYVPKVFGEDKYLITASEIKEGFVPGKRSVGTNVAVVTALLSAGLHDMIRKFLGHNDMPELEKNEVFAWRLCDNSDGLPNVYREAIKHPRCIIDKRMRTGKHKDFPLWIWNNSPSYLRFIKAKEFRIRPNHTPAGVLIEYLHQHSEQDLFKGQELEYEGRKYKLTLELK